MTKKPDVIKRAGITVTRNISIILMLSVVSNSPTLGSYWRVRFVGAGGTWQYGVKDHPFPHTWSHDSFRKRIKQGAEGIARECGNQGPGEGSEASLAPFVDTELGNPMYPSLRELWGSLHLLWVMWTRGGVYAVRLWCFVLNSFVGDLKTLSASMIIPSNDKWFLMKDKLERIWKETVMA